MEVKIVWFTATPKSTKEAEQEIASLLSAGWTVSTAGGGRNMIEQSCLQRASVSTGFVMLQREQKLKKLS